MKKILTLGFAILLALTSFTAIAADDTIGDKVITCPVITASIDLAVADIVRGDLLPVTAAKELGLFQKHCVDVNLVQTKGDQSRLLMTGKIDAISEPIELLHVDMIGTGYADILVVRVVSDKPSLALVTKSGDDGTGFGRSINLEDRLRDLNGKTVAVPVCDKIGSMVELSPNATATQHLRYMLEKVGLKAVCGTPSDPWVKAEDNTVYLQVVGTEIADIIKIAKSGEVDAAVVPSPYHVTKGLRVIVNNVEFPDVPGAAIMVMREWYQHAKNRDTVARMHAALAESTEWLIKNPGLAKAMIWKQSYDYAQTDLSVEQVNQIYADGASIWDEDGIVPAEAIAGLQWVNMSDLGLKVGLCGCPGTDDSYAFATVGGTDPEGQRDGYILYVTPAHNGSFEGLIAHQSDRWRKAFQKIMNHMGITDPSKLHKLERQVFYDALRDELGGDSEGY